MEEVLLAVVAVALGMKTDEVAEAAKSDDGKEKLLEAYKAKNKEITTQAFNNGASDREKKVKTDFETDLKTTFGITSDKKGQALFDQIKETSGKPEKLSDDAVKASKLYIDLEKKVETAKDEAKQEYDAELKKRDDEKAQADTLAEVLKDAFTEFDSLNPLLSKEETRKANQRTLFAEQMKKGFQYEKLKDGSWLVKKEDGSRVEDEGSNRVSFKDHVKKVTTGLFDLKEATDRTSTGDDPQGGQGGESKKKVYTGAAPKTYAEFEKIQRDKSIPASERLEIANAYNASQEAAGGS